MFFNALYFLNNQFQNLQTLQCILTLVTIIYEKMSFIITYILEFLKYMHQDFKQFLYIHTYTLNNAGLFRPKIESNMGKPKCWVKNVRTSTFTFNSKFFNDIFNPTFGFVHI